MYTQFWDEVTRTVELDVGPAWWIFYTRNYKKLILGSESGHLSILPIEGEIVKEDQGSSSDEDNKHEEADIKISQNELGHYHTKKITGIKELGDTTQVVTVSEDCLMIIWEATNGSYLTRENIGVPLTSLEVS